MGDDEITFLRRTETMLRALLAPTTGCSPDRFLDVVSNAAAALGAVESEVLLIDHGQTVLVPLGVWVASGQRLDDDALLGLHATAAGRAFMTREALEAEVPQGVTRWVPVTSCGEAVAVLELTFGALDDDTRQASGYMASLVADLLIAKDRHTDLYELARRRRRMSLAGELQWQQLPPRSTSTPGLDAAGILEPAYDVCGDGFDYSCNGDRFDLAIIDAVGHDLSAAMLSGLALASLKHSRRNGVGLADALAAADDALVAVFSDLSYATVQLAQIHVPTGQLRYVNVGHPVPLLVRRGRVIDEQSCPPRVPIGLGHLVPGGPHAQLCEISLEPGDRVLFYTDGVVEGGHRGREPFGLARLIDLLERADQDAVDCAETLRRVTRSVLGHAKYELRDDSTLVLVEWHGAGQNDT